MAEKRLNEDDCLPNILLAQREQSLDPDSLNNDINELKLRIKKHESLLNE